MSRLGPYRIVARIGSGGMAEVFEAQRFGASGFCKVVAVKVLLPERAEEPELQRLLIAEAKLGAAMAHRNLVAVSDLGVHEGRYYMVMEHVDGADLGVLLDRARPPQPVAMHIVDAVAAGLEYLHDFCDEQGRPLGLVHRDVSPGNVLVSRTGEVKLGDYGIAKATHLASETRARIVRGKFAYLSPEQVHGTSVTARSDQFALGVLLVELLTGHRPFDGPSPVDTMERIRSATAPDLTTLTEPLRSIATRCLAPNPHDRFDTITALRAAVRAASGHEGIADSRTVAQWVRTTLDPRPPVD